MALHGGHARREEAVGGVLTFDMGSDSTLDRWARAAGMEPQAVTIGQICPSVNATNPDWTFAVSADKRGLVASPVVASPVTITLGYHEHEHEPNPLRHNPLTPDPADRQVRP